MSTADPWPVGLSIREGQHQTHAGATGHRPAKKDLLPPGGEPIRSASVSYPAAWFGFTWPPAKGHWLVSMDAAPAVTASGARLPAATVVIQHTTVRTSRFLEYGSPRPMRRGTGAGTALVLRDGRAWTTHWSRSAANGGTTFTTASGRPMTFAPGQVWAVLAHR